MGYATTGREEPSPFEPAREQAEEFEKSGGQEATTMHDLPIIVLTSKGAKTGKLRKTPLMRVEHEGSHAAVASLGGAPKHPVWYHNLKKEPHGEERDIWWRRAVEAFPPYAGYQSKRAG
ncbi:nitroreductase/quinone reductase family protein [Sciscionella marina]|uniref:nitroreductase/quinone reductase family protein n=1 Tax=Sciscionella marina TaxID=508770 RepID=UPI00036A65D4